jgi:hypothetical protein
MYDHRLWEFWVGFGGAHHPDRWVLWTLTGTPTGTPTGIPLSWMPTADVPYCGFRVRLVYSEMDWVWLWLELGWVGFGCVQGKARLCLVVFGIRSGLV